MNVFFAFIENVSSFLSLEERNRSVSFEGDRVKKKPLCLKVLRSFLCQQKAFCFLFIRRSKRGRGGGGIAPAMMNNINIKTKSEDSVV